MFILFKIIFSFVFVFGKFVMDEFPELSGIDIIFVILNISDDS